MERTTPASVTIATPTTTVSGRGARRWESGHPWIFRSDVVTPPGSDAGVARVHDQRGRPLGVALWSPRSEISLRLLDREDSAVVDQSWWTARIAAAAARRLPLTHVTNAWRVVHGEGDGLPSLVVDRYGEYIVVQLSSAGVEACRADIVAALIDLFQPAGILARNDAGSREREGLRRETVLLHGEVPEEIEVDEYGVRYLAAPWTGQKTGAFLDQRENRHLIGELACGETLDCFSYHGSFALHLARKARHVTALDASAPALERAAANAERNGLSNISFVVGDAFDFLRAREHDCTRYDTIVLDPPAFAKNKPSLPGAIRGYKDINMRAMRLLAPGGLLYTASCSFHLTRPLFLDMLRSAAADSGRRIVLRELTGQALDHPEVVTVPETGYLKGALLEADG
jgi:23S rRNA (cytosine1962-C5)-methyltransferase